MVINSNSDFITINAYAGTGKTSTLVGFSKARSSLKILYTSFNTSVIEESKKKFPSNVSSFGFHSIAYSHLGYRYKHRFKSNFNFFELKKFLSGFEINLKSKDIYILIDALEYYCLYYNSSFEPVYDRVCPKDFSIDKDDFVSIMEIIWEGLSDFSSNMSVTHDFYLKLFVMENKDLGYDLIMVDEAQDSNDVMVGFIDDQHRKGVNIVIVGDRHQSIYRFRGSVNALSEFSESSFYYLTKSFRFNDRVAKVVNHFIRNSLKEDCFLSGVGEGGEFSKVDTTKNYAVIARTNYSLVSFILEELDKNNGIRFSFYDKKNKSSFSNILSDLNDLYNLDNRNKKAIRNKFFLNSFDIKDLEERAKYSRDQELIQLVRVYKKIRNNFNESILKLKNGVSDIKEANILLGTVHKFKGLEFNQVKLLDDFGLKLDKKGEIFSIGDYEEEVNIIYVALTRSKGVVDIGDRLKRIIKERAGGIYMKNRF